MNQISIVAIIPARMGSTRYPGKPLLEINGIPMIEHVRRRAILCSHFQDVIVATCDKEIFDTVKSFGGNVCMTSSKHEMASDRLAEAVSNVDCTHVVNVQGDEILVLPQDLDVIAKSIKENPEAPFWNAIAPIISYNELSDNSIVKCILDKENKILYCSRNFSYLNIKKGHNHIKKILGLIVYRKEFLKIFSDLPRSPIETFESIDQMRIIENGEDLLSINLINGYPGINEPREEKLVRKILSNDNVQREVLAKILD